MKKQKYFHGWQMYAFGLLTIGLLALTHYLAPSPGLEQFLEIGALLLGYGLVAWWLEANPAELIDRQPDEVDRQPVDSPGYVLFPVSPQVSPKIYEDVVIDSEKNGKFQAPRTIEYSLPNLNHYYSHLN